MSKGYDSGVEGEALGFGMQKKGKQGKYHTFLFDSEGDK
jgi:hypothetical protein